MNGISCCLFSNNSFCCSSPAKCRKTALLTAVAAGAVIVAMGMGGYFGESGTIAYYASLGAGGGVALFSIIALYRDNNKFARIRMLKIQEPQGSDEDVAIDVSNLEPFVSDGSKIGYTYEKEILFVKKDSTSAKDWQKLIEEEMAMADLFNQIGLPTAKLRRVNLTNGGLAYISKSTKADPHENDKLEADVAVDFDKWDNFLYYIVQDIAKLSKYGIDRKYISLVFMENVPRCFGSNFTGTGEQIALLPGEASVDEMRSNLEFFLSEIVKKTFSDSEATRLKNTLVERYLPQVLQHFNSLSPG